MKRHLTTLLFLSFALFLQTAQAQESDSALDGFDPVADGQVRSVLVAEDGSLIVAGQFQNIAGVARQRIARLHGDGTDAGAYGLGANGTVFALEAAGGGKVYAGGAFGVIGGEARPNLGRLNADGSIDNGFVPTPALDGIVFALEELADGSVLAGGVFTGRLVRLNEYGTVHGSLSFAPDGAVHVLRELADGSILVGGAFSERLVKLAPDGTLNPTFQPVFDGPVRSLGVQADGKIVVGGEFTGKVKRLLANGAVDADFTATADDTVSSLLVEDDGRIVMGGQFGTVNGTPRAYIARLRTDGSLDEDFNPGADEEVVSLTRSPEGKILACGEFSQIGGETRNYLAKLYRSGAVDVDWNPNASVLVSALAADRDGAVFVGGSFVMIGGESVLRIAKLDEGGTRISSFTDTADFDDSLVHSLALSGLDELLMGGQFTEASGQARDRVARYGTDGTLDEDFAPTPGGTVYSTVGLRDGAILLGGDFGLIRVDSNGVLDPTFAPSPLRLMAPSTLSRCRATESFSSEETLPRSPGRRGRVWRDSRRMAQSMPALPPE